MTEIYLEHTLVAETESNDGTVEKHRESPRPKQLETKAGSPVKASALQGNSEKNDSDEVVLVRVLNNPVTNIHLSHFKKITEFFAQKGKAGGQQSDRA